MAAAVVAAEGLLRFLAGGCGGDDEGERSPAGRDDMDGGIDARVQEWLFSRQGTKS